MRIARLGFGPPSGYRWETAAEQVSQYMYTVKRREASGMQCKHKLTELSLTSRDWNEAGLL